jgi:hypothetical protein
MADVQLQEQLTLRLEEFARELLFVQADRACELFSSLLAREGAVTVVDGKPRVGGRPFQEAARELAHIVAEGTGLSVIVAFGESVIVSAPRGLEGEEVPDLLSTTCYVRGDAFSGPVELGGERYLVGARTLSTDGARAIVASGARASKTNEALLGLTSIQAEIIQLSEELQQDRRRSVADFLKVIRSIAKRIHLLALNASILSAQAGEHGRGFSVVAREIGELAERTRQSTTELEQDFLGVAADVPVERRSGGRRGTV